MTNTPATKPSSQSLEPSCSLDEAVSKYKLSKKFILNLIEKGYIHGHDMTQYGMGYRIWAESAFTLKVISQNPEYKKKILNITPSYISDFNPYLVSYLEFHDFLDRYCWILKLNYSNKADIKKKKYRLDVLLQEYLIQNKFNLSKLSQASKCSSDSQTIFHLQKGWYNEMANMPPLSKDWLDIGTKIHKTVNDSSEISWNIIKAYYAIYEYTNSTVFSFSNSFDTSQHKKSIKVFNNSILGKLVNRLYFYPFNISSTWDVNTLTFPKHLIYLYSRYPRDKSKTIVELSDDIQHHLQGMGSQTISLIDFMYAFRVWANYTGIETILSLEDGYLLTYLFKNLTTITFFTAAFAELSTIATLGEAKYFSILEDFSSRYIQKQAKYDNKYLVPLYVRARIYHHLGIVSQVPDFCLPELTDPISFKAII